MPGPLAGGIGIAHQDLDEIHHLVHGGDDDGAGILDLRLHRGEIADQRAGVRLRGLARLGAAARLHQHDRLAGGARAAAGREEFLRPADLLAVERDHAGRGVVGEELDEIGAFEAGLVAGRDHVGERKAEPVGGALEVTEQAAALADEGDTVLRRRACASRANSMCSHMPSTLLVTPRQLGPTTASPAARAVAVTASCVALIADLGEAGGEYHRRADLAARAGLDRLAHAGGRQREHGEVDALGQLVRALEHRPAVDRLAAAADQMDVAREVVELERLQDDLAGAAGARRHSDDRHRARPQEPGDRLGPARVFRSAHAAPLSGWNMSRCVPSSSGCQYGFTFMPTFRSSALQLTMLAMKLTPTSSVTLTTA